MPENVGRTTVMMKDLLNGTFRDRLGTPSITGTVVNLISSSFHHKKFLLVIAIIFRMI